MRQNHHSVAFSIYGDLRADRFRRHRERNSPPHRASVQADPSSFRVGMLRGFNGDVLRLSHRSAMRNERPEIQSDDT